MVNLGENLMAIKSRHTISSVPSISVFFVDMSKTITHRQVTVKVRLLRNFMTNNITDRHVNLETNLKGISW